MAEYQIDVNRLKKDELQYELRVRGFESGDKPVAELRTALRPLLRMESENRSLSYPKFALVVEDELNVIATKLADLSLLLQEATDSASTRKHHPLQTRLTHLMKRTDRLPNDALSEEQRKRKSELLMTILGKFDALDSLTKATASGSSGNLSHVLLRQPTATSDDSMSSSSDSEPPHNSTSVRSSVRTRHLPVYKWNLKFSGDPKDLSVHNFLERVDELRNARGLTMNELFEQSLDLFEGKALIWFRANRHRVTDWKSLTALLLQHYQPPDYKSRLFQEILTRTQHPSESIVDYLACMTGMFNRYGKIPEDVRLDIISRNLSPFYTMQLPVVRSIRELEAACLELEVKKYRTEHYAPPSQKKSSSVEPNFAYVSHTAVNTVNEVSIAEGISNLDIAAVRSSVTCWNCRKTGHLLRSCPAPHQKVCYRCGQPGETVRSCPKCQNPGNLNRGN